MKRHVVGASRLPSGALVCAATDGRHNVVFLNDGTGEWRELVRWSGKRVTACCARGEATVVCAADDDVAYVIEGTTVSPVALPEQTHAAIYGACPISPDSVLLGGAGGLFLLSTRDKSAVRKRLSDLNVSKPGRNILNLVRTAGGRTMILGVKNLLVDYRGDTAVEPVPRDSLRGREVMFGDAVDLADGLWLSAQESVQAKLARLEGDALQFHDTPQPGQRMARLGVLNGELLVAGDKLSVGRPGAWRDVPASALTQNDAFVALTPCGGDECCAVSADGRSFFTDGRACREARMF